MENNVLDVQLDIINKFLRKTVEPYLIILFGSAARGQLRSDSDLDLAFLSDLALSEYEVFMRAQELSGLLGREVDLIDLNKASTVLKAQIIGRGKVIYNSDNLRRMVFAMKALKEYALLNEERQCILERFKERGLNNYAE